MNWYGVISRDIVNAKSRRVYIIYNILCKKEEK